MSRQQHGVEVRGDPQAVTTSDLEHQQPLRASGARLGDIVHYLVRVSPELHRRIHTGRGFPGRWNDLWDEWIEANPGASARKIGRFASELLKDFGIDHLPIGR